LIGFWWFRSDRQLRWIGRVRNWVFPLSLDESS
jgi:hypothetical protein